MRFTGRCGSLSGSGGGADGEPLGLVWTSAAGCRSPDSLRLPIASELEGALADWLAEGLVRSDRVESFALRFGLVSQPVDQTQRLTLRSLVPAPGGARFRSDFISSSEEV